MTKKRLEMTKTQLKSIGPSTNTKSSELQSSIEPVSRYYKLPFFHLHLLCSSKSRLVQRRTDIETLTFFFL